MGRQKYVLPAPGAADDELMGIAFCNAPIQAQRDSCGQQDVFSCAACPTSFFRWSAGLHRARRTPFRLTAAVAPGFHGHGSCRIQQPEPEQKNALCPLSSGPGNGAFMQRNGRGTSTGMPPETHRPRRGEPNASGSPAPTGCTGPCGPAAASPGQHGVLCPAADAGPARVQCRGPAPLERSQVSPQHIQAFGRFQPCNRLHDAEKPLLHRDAVPSAQRSIRCAHPAHRAAGQNRPPPSLFRSAHTISRQRGTMPRPKGPADGDAVFLRLVFRLPEDIRCRDHSPRAALQRAQRLFPYPAFRPAASHAREPGRLRSAPCRTHSPVDVPGCAYPA